MKTCTTYTGFCEVCSKTEGDQGSRLHMDHCHETGRFRGWLCSACNVVLGHMSDSVERLLTLIDYLER